MLPFFLTVVFFNAVVPNISALSMALTCASLLRLEDGVYKGIVVSIGERVPEGQGEQIIIAIKKMFEDASPVLHTAMLKQASFGQVTILIPKSWDKNKYQAMQASYETFADAQIRVDSANPVYGHAPYTQQSKGCGEQGDFIHFSPEYLVDLIHAEQRYGNPAKVLVHEWAHYRYGIFDEYGYPGDPIYPHIYGDSDGNPRHTGCSDSTVQGTFSDQCQLDESTGQYSKDCRFTPDPSQSHIFSSLMYMHFLPKVEFFCNDTNLPHNKEAPTKQNALCDGRSTWDVISKHPDFNHQNEKIISETAFTPTFKVVQTGPPRFYFLWDISAGMQDNERFHFTKIAVSNFMSYFLPKGSMMGLLTFDNKVQDEVNMTSDVHHLKHKFPTGTMPDRANWKTFVAALKAGQQGLKQQKGGILVLISAGFADPPTDNGQQFSDICHTLQLNGIKVVSILYPFNVASSDPANSHLSTLAEKTNGRNFFVYENSIGQNTKSWVLSQLTSALATIGQMDSGDSGSDYVLVEDSKLYYGQEISGTITLDSSLGKHFTILLTTKTPSLVNKYSIVITDPHNHTFDHKNIQYNDNTFYFERTAVADGDWKFYLKMSAAPPLAGEPSISVTALATPKDKEHEPIKVNSWTNVGTKQVDPTTMPVIIYAEVKKGNRPVQNARVVAKIARPRPFNGDHSTITLQLLDNGSGEPDLIRGDGIYSRYFTDFGNTGHYLLSVFVDDNSGTAIVVGQKGYSGVLPVNPTELSYCCGSSTGVQQASVPTFSFTRSMNAGTFNVIKLMPEGMDIMKPGKVTDLQIKMSKPGQQSVVLMWTAPGDNYDSGIADHYEVKVANSRAEILNNFDNLQSASDIPQPLEGGKIQDFEVTHSLRPDKQIVFYALRAVDAAGNKGRISNIVGIEFPALPSTTMSMIPGATPPTKPTPAGDKLTAAEIGIILGCVLGLLLIILILIVFIILHRRRQKARHVSAATGNGSYPFKAPNLDSTLAENGKHTLLPQQQTLEKPSKTNHVGSNGNVFTVDSPQFMTASELLERHEQHKRSNKDGGSMMGDDELEKPRPPSDSYYISHHYNDELQPPPNYTHGYNGPNNSFERTSFSDKPSSSFTSLSTNEHRRDNGYFTSYEETSEDSGVVKHPGGVLPPPGPLTSSKTSLSSQRRIVSESQV